MISRVDNEITNPRIITDDRFLAEVNPIAFKLQHDNNVVKKRTWLFVVKAD